MRYKQICLPVLGPFGPRAQYLLEAVAGRLINDKFEPAVQENQWSEEDNLFSSDVTRGL